MKEFAKRVLVAVFGIPLVIMLTYLGGWYFFALIFIIAIGAQIEFYLMQKKKNLHPHFILGLISGLLLLLGIQTEEWHFFGQLFIISLMLIFVSEMRRNNKNVSSDIGVTLLGIFYIPFFLATLLYSKIHVDRFFLSVENSGFKFIMILLAGIWICDTFAYGFGKFFGKHKLYTKVSPNKTIEGGVAGLIGAVCAFALAKIFHCLPMEWPAAILFGLVVGVIGQTGDLVESWFKRDAGIKDSSNILPGHGGFLDRFDSLIFLSPAMFVLVLSVL